MASSVLITKVFLVALVIKNLIIGFLDGKNRQCVLKHKDQVPERFAEKISLEEHQKAAHYTIAKSKLGQFFNIIGFFILLAWTLGGGLEALNQIVLKMNFSQKISGILFFALFALISTVISLPQSIYSTFVLEEKFGFNKTTPKLFIIDLIKGLVLGALIGLPVLYVILWIMEKLGEYWWIYAWAFLTAFQFILIWAYPRIIAPLFNKFSPLEEGEVKEKVLGLLERTGFQSKGLFIMDASKRSTHGNAYFTGFGKNKRIVFFDTLIKNLQPSEVEAVLAHELGHFKRKHIIKGLIKGILFSFIGFAVLGFLMKWPAFYLGHGVKTQTPYMALMLFALVSGVYTFFLTPLSSWLSRRYEFEADAFAAENANASDLISALVKLYKDNASTLTPDPLYSAFYHSHPPAAVRVQHLEKLGSK